MMNFIDTLSKWQTLVGSILGGIFVLSTALVVARSARNGRSDRAGAATGKTWEEEKGLKYMLCPRNNRKCQLVILIVSINND